MMTMTKDQQRLLSLAASELRASTKAIEKSSDLQIAINHHSIFIDDPTLLPASQKFHREQRDLAIRQQRAAISQSESHRRLAKTYRHQAAAQGDLQ